MVAASVSAGAAGWTRYCAATDEIDFIPTYKIKTNIDLAAVGLV